MESNKSESDKISNNDLKSSLIYIRWFIALFAPIITFVFVFFSFIPAYMLIFKIMDSGHFIGDILLVPISLLSSLFVLYITLPKFKFGITTFVCTILFIKNTFETINTLAIGTDYSTSRTIQNIISYIIIYIILVKFPKYIYSMSTIAKTSASSGESKRR